MGKRVGGMSIKGKFVFILIALAVLCIPVFGQTTTNKTCEVRGQVATSDFTWNPQNFAGFYYDIKNDLGTETLSTTLTDKKLSGDSPYGVRYVTSSQPTEFKFENWGSYNMIGFLGEKYFAGYIESDDASKNIFFKESTDENSLSCEQLETILLDSEDEIIVTYNNPLKLAEDYELSIKYIDNNSTYLELKKNGDVVDSEIISPFKSAATEAEKTYFYRSDVGKQRNLVVLGVHFKNALIIENQTVATVDGIWQLSDTPIEVQANTEHPSQSHRFLESSNTRPPVAGAIAAKEIETGTQYDKMTITLVDANAGTIIMENTDNAITLIKNKETALIGGISIRTADNDTLRYYIYSECECG
jgi:S-layer protein (TIGR01567 family)